MHGFDNDYIVDSPLKQESFSQVRPHHVCQCRGKMWQVSEQAGYEIKCRDPRCSLACLRNWCHKQAALTEYFLDEILPVGHTVYRGNLTPQANTNPADHIKLRASFKRALARRCGGRIAFRATLHITSETNAHYDIVAYAQDDLSPKEVAQAIKESWSVAGGKRATCKPLHSDDELDDEVKAISSYTFKPDARYKHVPLRKRDGGIKLTFESAGFWRGWNADKVWVARNEALFPKRYRAVFLADQWAAHAPITIGRKLTSDESDLMPEAMSSESSAAPITIGRKLTSDESDLTLEKSLESPENEAQSAESVWRSFVGVQDEITYTIGSRVDARVAAFAASFPGNVLVAPVVSTYKRPDPETVLASDVHIGLPRTPQEAVTVAELAERIGWLESSVKGQLDALPNVVHLDSTLTADGRVVHDAYYRPKKSASANKPISQAS